LESVCCTFLANVFSVGGVGDVVEEVAVDDDGGVDDDGVPMDDVVDTVVMIQRMDH
jgi:ribosomal protein S6E (S10)